MTTTTTTIFKSRRLTKSFSSAIYHSFHVERFLSHAIIIFECLLFSMWPQCHYRKQSELKKRRITFAHTHTQIFFFTLLSDKIHKILFDFFRLVYFSRFSLFRKGKKKQRMNKEHISFVLASYSTMAHIIELDSFSLCRYGGITASSRVTILNTWYTLYDHFIFV